jgi:predicted glycosyltransferase
LDAPGTVRRRWQLEGAFEAVDRHVHEVLVYGSQEVFDVAKEYAWPDALTRKLRYCGYVCAPPSPTSPEAVRRRYLAEAPDAKLVVAMAGGGADAFDLFQTLLRAAPALSHDRPCVLVVITGPYLPEADQQRLRQIGAGLPVHFVVSVADSLSYISAADVVVAMAGYNTTTEILSTRRPAVLVPRPGPSAEQQMRASRFADRDWVRWVPPDSLSPETLASTITEALQAPTLEAASRPDLGGRQRAATILVYGSSDMPLGRDRTHASGVRSSALVPAQRLGEG